MPPLTDGQEKLLALLPIVPALLSFAGSLTILYIVYQHFKRNQTTVYHRLLVAMSICDAITSFWYPWTAFLMPADTSTRVWAIGTDGTCTFTGFLFNFSFVGILYNICLSYYFLLTARFGWKDPDIAKRVEPILHAVALLFPLTCGIVFAALGVYGEQPIGLGCWVSDYPHGCGSEPGQEPCITPLLGWISAGIPIVLSFASLLVNNLLIYCHVRATLNKARRYSSQFTNNSSSSGFLSSRRPSLFWKSGQSTESIRPSFASSGGRSTITVQDSQSRRLQAVAIQAGLYVLVFFLNYIWTVVLKILGAQERYWTSEYESELFGLLVLQAIFFPLQGFFNLLVFSRPKYLSTRKTFPHESRFWAFQRAMFGEGKAPLHQGPSRLTNLTIHSHHTNHPPPPVSSNLPLTIDEQLQAGVSNATTKSAPSDRSFDAATLQARILSNATNNKNNCPSSGQIGLTEETMKDSQQQPTPPKIPSRSASLRQSLTLSSLFTWTQPSSQFSLPFRESMDRPVQQSEFDAFLYGFELSELLEEEDEANEEDIGAFESVDQSAHSEEDEVETLPWIEADPSSADNTKDTIYET